MGIVLRFPDERRRTGATDQTGPESPCEIIILPVVRIERHTPATAPNDTPSRGGDTPRRKRKSA